MNGNIYKKFKDLKGQICTLEMKRPMTILKPKTIKARHDIDVPTNLIIEKWTKMQCRAGVSYDNIQNVVEKRESGELPKENQGRPYGEWVEYPYIAEYKGQKYFRFSTIPTNMKREVKYLLNGKPITEEEAKKYCGANEFGDRNKLDVFEVKEESIIELT